VQLLTALYRKLILVKKQKTDLLATWRTFRVKAPSCRRDPQYCCCWHHQGCLPGLTSSIHEEAVQLPTAVYRKLILVKKQKTDLLATWRTFRVKAPSCRRDPPYCWHHQGCLPGLTSSIHEEAVQLPIAVYEKNDVSKGGKTYLELATWRTFQVEAPSCRRGPPY